MELGLTPRTQLVKLHEFGLFMRELAAIRGKSLLDNFEPVRPVPGAAPSAAAAAPGASRPPGPSGAPPGSVPSPTPHRPSRPPGSAAHGAQWHDGLRDDAGWRDACRAMVRHQLSELERVNMRSIYDRPVDEAALPNYRRIIHRPMDLGTVEARLKRDETDPASGQTCRPTHPVTGRPVEPPEMYRSAQEFHEDMSLVWSNCKARGGEREGIERGGGICTARRAGTRQFMRRP